MSLVARHLETAGIPTVIIGSALDILRHCGAPRFVFTDFPLGNPCGKPWDRAMQRQILEMALRLLEDARTPGAMRESGFAWSEDQSWRDNYMRVHDGNREQLRAMGELRRHQQTAAKAGGRTRVE